MCILLLVRGAHRRLPFLCIHSRDEALGRRTGPIALSSDGVLGPVDAVAGGTWVGLHVERGHFAALTNVRRALPLIRDPTSRGVLVGRVLRESLPHDGHLAFESYRFAGFNMLHARLWDDSSSSTSASSPSSSSSSSSSSPPSSPSSGAPRSGCPSWFVTNRPTDETLRRTASLRSVAESHGMHSLPPAEVVAEPMGDGVFVFSNSSLNDDSWRKVAWLRTEAERVLTRWQEEQTRREPRTASQDSTTLFLSLFQPLAALFTNQHIPAADPSPASAPVRRFPWSPVSDAIEEYLQASVFLRDRHHQLPGFVPYGTRALSVGSVVDDRWFFGNRSFDGVQDAFAREALSLSTDTALEESLPASSSSSSSSSSSDSSSSSSSSSAAAGPLPPPPSSAVIPPPPSTATSSASSSSSTLPSLLSPEATRTRLAALGAEDVSSTVNEWFTESAWPETLVPRASVAREPSSSTPSDASAEAWVSALWTTPWTVYRGVCLPDRA